MSSDVYNDSVANSIGYALLASSASKYLTTDRNIAIFKDGIYWKKLSNNQIINPCAVRGFSPNYSTKKCSKGYSQYLSFAYRNNYNYTGYIRNYNANFINNSSVITNITSPFYQRSADWFRCGSNGRCIGDKHHGLIRKSDGYYFISGEYAYGNYNVNWTNFQNF